MRHGKKPLYTLVLYDKRKRVADMKQGKTLTPTEVATVHENFRFDITAHSVGIVALIRAARNRLESLRHRGLELPAVAGLEDFERRDERPTARWLQIAILILSHRVAGRALVRQSFADWLAPTMIRGAPNLDVIARFRRDAFHRVETPPPASMTLATRIVGKAISRPLHVIAVKVVSDTPPPAVLSARADRAAPARLDAEKDQRAALPAPVANALV